MAETAQVHSCKGERKLMMTLERELQFPSLHQDTQLKTKRDESPRVSSKHMARLSHLKMSLFSTSQPCPVHQFHHYP